MCILLKKSAKWLVTNKTADKVLKETGLVCKSTWVHDKQQR